MLSDVGEELLVEEDHDRSSLTYVIPSSHMVVDGNSPLAAAALALDAKLAALAAKSRQAGADSTPSLAPLEITNHGPMPASNADNSIGGAL